MINTKVKLPRKVKKVLKCNILKTTSSSWRSIDIKIIEVRKATKYRNPASVRSISTKGLVPSHYTLGYNCKPDRKKKKKVVIDCYIV